MQGGHQKGKEKENKKGSYSHVAFSIYDEIYSFTIVEAMGIAWEKWGVLFFFISCCEDATGCVIDDTPLKE